MFSLNIKADVQPAVNQLNAIKQGLGDRALASALNKVGAQARTQMVRAITDEYVISASEVRGRIELLRASRSGQRFVVVVTGEAKRRAFNLIRFVETKTTLAQAKRRAKQGTLGQVFFQVRRSGGKKTIEGAFIGNRGRTVFRRIGKARLPIEPVRVIGVPQMFNAKKIRTPVEQFIVDKFPEIFAHELRYFLSTVG